MFFFHIHKQNNTCYNCQNINNYLLVQKNNTLNPTNRATNPKNIAGDASPTNSTDNTPVNNEQRPNNINPIKHINARANVNVNLSYKMTIVANTIVIIVKNIENKSKCQRFLYF